VLGGFGYSAYYIVGFDNKGRYFYLDPHYTQDAKDYMENGKVDMESYFKQKTISEIKFNKMNSCVQFGFLIKGNKGFYKFYNQLRNLFDPKNYEDCFISECEYMQVDLEDIGNLVI